MTAHTATRDAARPTAPDDLATVWSAWFARRPLIWGAELACVAGIALARDSFLWPACVAVAAARRTRSPTLVPDTHPLVTDFGVARR